MRAAAFGPQGLGSSAAQYPKHSGTPARALAAAPALRPWACALFRTCGPPRGAALAEARHAPACARKRAYQQGARSSRTTRIRGGRKRPKHTARTGGSGWHRRICWTDSSGALPATCRYRCACNQKAPAARSCGRCRLSPSSAAPEVLHHSARIKSGRLACRTPPVCVPNAHNGYYIPAVSMAKLQCE